MVMRSSDGHYRQTASLYPCLEEPLIQDSPDSLTTDPRVGCDHMDVGYLRVVLRYEPQNKTYHSTTLLGDKAGPREMLHIDGMEKPRH